MKMEISKGKPMNPSSTPPKLSIYSFPSNRPEPPWMATPPLHLPGSIPFHWEEAPGRPRTHSISSCPPPPPKAKPSLDLPPRPVEVQVANMSSPTDVLDGPYVLGRATSLPSSNSCSFVGEDRSKNKERVGRLDGSSSLSSSSSSCSRPFSSYSCDDCYGGDGVGEEEETKVRIMRFRRKRCLAGLSSYAAYYVWANIYGSLKQVIPWRKRVTKI